MVLLATDEWWLGEVDDWTKVANQFLVEILAKLAIVIYACSPIL